jgi:hypothetical protein
LLGKRRHPNNEFNIKDAEDILGSDEDYIYTGGLSYMQNKKEEKSDEKSQNSNE